MKKAAILLIVFLIGATLNSKENTDFVLLQNKPNNNSLSGIVDLDVKSIEKLVKITDLKSKKTLKIDISKLKLENGKIILYNPQLKSIFKEKFKVGKVFSYKYKKLRPGNYLLKIKTEEGSYSMTYVHK